VSRDVVKRYVKVDPFAICDLARERSLTANDQHVLLLLAIQSEYRSAEWTGTLTDISDATRLARRTVPRVVGHLIELGLLEVVEPFRPGTEGRVRIVDRDRLIYTNPRKRQIASIDVSTAPGDLDRTWHGPGPVLDDISQSDAIEQEKEGVSLVKRQRGMKVSDDQTIDGSRCGCGEPIEGHSFDHEPELSIVASHFPEAVDVSDTEYELRREATRP
jgi:hypothetical protein